MPDVPLGTVVTGVCSVSVPEALVIVLTPVNASPAIEPACVPLTVHVDALAGPVIAFATLGSRLSCWTFVSVIVWKSPPELVPVAVVPFQVQVLPAASAGIVSEFVPLPPVSVIGTGIEPPVMSIVQRDRARARDEDARQARDRRRLHRRVVLDEHEVRVVDAKDERLRRRVGQRDRPEAGAETTYVEKCGRSALTAPVAGVVGRGDRLRAGARVEVVDARSGGRLPDRQHGRRVEGLDLRARGRVDRLEAVSAGDGRAEARRVHRHGRDRDVGVRGRLPGAKVSVASPALTCRHSRL